MVDVLNAIGSDPFSLPKIRDENLDTGVYIEI